MKRRLCRLVFALAISLALLGVFASSALAELDDVAGDPGSISNPGVWWRLTDIPGPHVVSWGNSLAPDFVLQPVTPEEGTIIGALYTVDRSEATVIDTTTPDAYYRAARSLGSNMDFTLDLPGIYLYPPTGSWPPAEAGTHSPLEGIWWYHYLFFSNVRLSNTTNSHVFGIDVTDPRAVTGLKASPSANPSFASNVVSTSRVHISWDPAAYDDLSGVAYYQVMLDGEPAIPEAGGEAQGRVYEIPGVTPSSVTLENLEPGAHSIGVYPVDRATNEGPIASVRVYSDPDTPTISITSPAGSIVGIAPTLQASANDLGGISSVSFYLDGIFLGTDTAAPYALRADLSGFTAGYGHTLSAKATDVYGRTSTDSKAVVLDKTPLVVSSFTAAPNPFFPIRREGYKDNATIRCWVNKNAYVRLDVLNSAGTPIRSMAKWVAPGTASFVWNGKWTSDNRAHTGTYYYRITAADPAGNIVTTGKIKTVIRNYELKRLSRSRVRVIPR